MATAKQKREKQRNNIIRRLTELAFGRANDAVELVILGGEEDLNRLDSLDLTLLSEVKRGQNGSVEVKLLNRLEVIKLLLDELRAEESEAGNVGSFFAALNETARNIEENSVGQSDGG